MGRDRPLSRRRLLSLTGGFAVGSRFADFGAAKRADSDPTQQRHRLVLNSPSSTRVDYEFAVTGEVRKTTETGGLFSADVVTRDPEDRIVDPAGFDGTVVRGVTQGGVDAYVYTGDIVSFDSTNCGSFNVWVNGSEQPACALNRNYNADVSAPDGGDGDSNGGSSATVERVRPDPEVSVVPGTTVLFEVAAQSQRIERLSKRIYVDGEGGHSGEPDLFYGQLDTSTSDVFAQEFETPGTHRVRVEVYDGNETELGTVDWTVHVSDGGNRPPTAERVEPRPMVLTVPPDSRPTYEFTLRASDPDGHLDNVVWWTSQCDQVLGTSSLQGSNGTATHSVDVYPSCPVSPFVVDDAGALTWFTGWLVREEGSSNNYVRFESETDTATTYEFAATEEIRQLGIRPNPSPDDTVRGTRASGRVGPGSDEDLFAFREAITALDVNGPASVFVNGEEVDPSAYPR